MNIVKVNTSSHYEVKIGSGLLASIGQEVAAVTKSKITAIVSDTNVWPLYGDIVSNSLKNAGFAVVSYVFEAGESSKSGATYLDLLSFLAKEHITRTDCIIALGGGVVGDLSGFVAATYLRGIPYVQVPTTLLAAVDSSVGGKTAIDLDCGKNLVGAFYQPKLVLCDTDTLNTLPKGVFQDGCAEVIKYGVLYDAALFSHLQEKGLDFDRESVITRCVELKRDTVTADEFDTGYRMKLNLGHTIGHGIELLSNYEISHGKAVAAGMALVSRAAQHYGLCSAEDTAAIIDTLTLFGLPTQVNYSPEMLYESALSDKKRAGNLVHLIVPRAIGNCEIRQTPTQELEAFIKAGF